MRKSVPQLVEHRKLAEELGQRINGSTFDTEYALEAIKSSNSSLSAFRSINENLKNAVHLAQQIQHMRSQKPSMYNSVK